MIASGKSSPAQQIKRLLIHYTKNPFDWKKSIRFFFFFLSYLLAKKKQNKKTD